MNNTCAVILAAGEGKRLKSSKPKAVCEILFKPMLSYVLDAVKEAGVKRICVVCGYGREYIEEILPEGVETAFQEERKGTAHALLCAEEFIKGSGCQNVFALNADAPFISSDDLIGALERHKLTESQMTIISAVSARSNSHGKILRDHGIFRGIIDDSLASSQQKQLTEVNTGCYVFDKEFILDYAKALVSKPTNEEKKLREISSLGLIDGKTVVPYKSKNSHIALGANTRSELYEIEKIARESVIEELMDCGVSFPCTDGVIIGKDVTIEKDAVIYPGVIIKGKSHIGEGSLLTTGTIIEDSFIGKNCQIKSSLIEKSSVGDGVKIGPYSHLRPDSSLADSVKVGNFVEIKNSSIGEKSSIAHLSYIGDTDMGGHVNVGCSTSTANYDGFRKFRTEIGDDCFIGCHTSLIAPVSLGKGAFTAAGSVITKNIPDGSLGVSRAKQETKEGWADRYNERNKAYKK